MEEDLSLLTSLLFCLCIDEGTLAIVADILLNHLFFIFELLFCAAAFAAIHPTHHRELVVLTSRRFLIRAVVFVANKAICALIEVAPCHSAVIVGMHLEVVTRPKLVLLCAVYLSNLLHLVSLLRVERVEKTVVVPVFARKVALTLISLLPRIVADEVIVSEPERGRFEVTLLPV